MTVHIMVDLETMAPRSNVPILDIAAVVFDPETGETKEEFFESATLDSNIEVGLLPTASTMKFWMDNPEAAKGMWGRQETAVHISGLMLQFTLWLYEVSEGGEYALWGNGSMSDNRWIDDALIKSGALELPYNCHRDVRTLVELGRMVGLEDYKKTMEFEGIPHNPLDDCKHQIKYCVAILNEIKG